MKESSKLENNGLSYQRLQQRKDTSFEMMESYCVNNQITSIGIVQLSIYILAIVCAVE